MNDKKLPVLSSKDWRISLSSNDELPTMLTCRILARSPSSIWIDTRTRLSGSDSTVGVIFAAYLPRL